MLVMEMNRHKEGAVGLGISAELGSWRRPGPPIELFQRFVNLMGRRVGRRFKGMIRKTHMHLTTFSEAKFR